MGPHGKTYFKGLAVACFVLPAASAAALDGTTTAEPTGKIASRGLERADRLISGSPVLISRADIESPLTRVRRVELIDAVENEVQGGG
jgi:hypothetical protein